MAESLRLQLDPTVCHFAADSAADDGTVGIVAYTGASVVRSGFYEDAKGREQYGRYMLRLSLDPEHVNIGRLNSGAAPLLREHEQHVDAVIGQIVAGSVEITSSGVTARAKLSDAPGDADVVAKIRSGIARNTSVGAFLHTIAPEDLEADPPTFVATSWEPFEVSAVAVGADPGARVELHLITPPAPPAQQEPSTMSTQHAPATFTAEELTNRNKTIFESARLLGLSGEKVQALTLDAAMTLDAARSELFRIKADADKAQGIDGSRTSIEFGADEDTKRAQTMGLALQARFAGKPLADDAAPYAREYRFSKITDLARECLRRAGQTDVARLHDGAVIEAAMMLRSSGGAAAYLSGGGAHSTSDFPLILADSARKSLRAGYELNPGIHRRIARQRTLRDYLAHKHVLLGSTPNFSELPENGVPNYGPLAESGGSVYLKDYASAVSVGRRAMINDDLDALLGIPFRFGQSAMRKEAAVTLAILTGGTSGDWGDGSALFASAHANIDTTGAAPSIARVGAMRLLMRLQTGVAHASQTAEALNIEPAFIIIPEALVVTTQQLFAGLYTPTAASTANVPALFNGLQIVSDPILDAASSTRWYMSCDPNRFDALEYCYLEGESGVVISSMPDWDSEGMKIKARLAFAAHAKDYRGLTTNAGA